MSKKYITAILFPLILLGSIASYAESSGSLPLLRIAPDARSVSLGESGIASAKGALAAFHNPALLPFSERSQAAFAYSDWLLDLSIQSGAVLFDYKRFSVALSFNVFNTPNLERRTVPADEPIGTFDAHDLTFGLSAAFPIWRNLTTGLTVRYIFQQIYVEEAAGFCGDAGIAWRIQPLDITLAAVVKNVGEMQDLQGEASPLPLIAGMGIQGTVLHKDDFTLGATADLHTLRDSDARLHGGVELDWKKLLTLRGGYQTGSELRSFSGGVGLSWKVFAFDYAYQPLAEDFNESHRFTLIFNF
ncbi:MAG: PorV/PorQ family protein [bacterium]